MKKRVGIISFLIVMFSFNIVVFAADTIAEVKIEGQVKKSENIDILVNLNDISRFYAGSIEFNYDNSLLKITSIKAADLISKDEVNKMEFGGDVDKADGKIKYQFTCVGKVDGFSGSGTFVDIKAEVLKDGDLNINKDNLKLQLCERTTNNEIKDITFSLKGVGQSSDSKASSNDGTTQEKTTNSNDSPNKIDGKTEDTKIKDSTTENNSIKQSNEDKKENNKGAIENFKEFFTSIFGKNDKKEDANVESKKTTDNSEETNIKKESSNGDSKDDNVKEEKGNSATDSSVIKSDTKQENSDKENEKVKNDKETKQTSNNSDEKNLIIIVVALVAASIVTVFYIFYVKRKKS